MKQILTIVLAFIIIYFGFTNKDVLLHIVESGGTLAYPVSILFVALLVFFPVLPYPALAGILGAVFGLWDGILISLVGISIGTLFMFIMTRFGFQSLAQRTLNKYPKVKEYEALFDSNAFVSILVARLIPIIPSPLINVLCGLSNVKWYTFFFATMLGKLPAVAIFTLAGNLFSSNKWLSILIYLTYFLIIVVMTTIKLKKKQWITSSKSIS